MSNELTPIDLVNQQESFFNAALGNNAVEWAKESQFAIQALGNNDYLAKAAMNAPAALQNAIINVAAIGISLNPALKHAYLVPRATKKGQAPVACLDISYQGLMHLAMQSGSIEWGQAKLVYENDHYENNGIDQAPTHKQKTFGDKGKLVGVYCTVKTSKGDYLTEEMDIEAINKVRNASSAANGPWKTWPEEMTRKTVVKRASKYWPKVDRLNLAIDAVNEHEGIEFEQVKEVPAVILVDDTEIENLTKAADMAGLTLDDLCKKAQINNIHELPAQRYEGALNWLKSQTIEEEQCA
jgi:recombination protein RecT